MSRLGLVPGLLGDPGRVAGTLLLLGFGVSGCSLAGLVYPPDARVDPLADIDLTSGRCLTFRLGLGLGMLGCLPVALAVPGRVLDGTHPAAAVR